MSALACLQQRFSRHVLRGDAPDIVAALCADDAAEAAQRFAIYADGYRLRLLEVVGREWTGLQLAMGGEAFEQMVRAYIEHHPSPHRNVRWYGDGLAAFLAATPPWSQQPALAELAALEWDMTLVFDAPNEQPMRLEQIVGLAAQDWPALPLRLLASVRHRRLHWNLAALRQAADRGEAVPDLRAQTTEVWAIWRYRHGVRYRCLEEDEAGLFTHLAQGLRFADVCEGLRQWHAEDTIALRAAALLRRWTEDEWLSAVALESFSPANTPEMAG